jgi:CDP-diacylglycerol--glycerol-3-phosphate 3-phosphatidyltransferase
VKTSGFLAATSSVRIVLVPVIMAFIVIDGDDLGSLAIAAAVLFAFAAATDFIDGYLARRWDVTTTLGSFLDTTADKLLVTGVLMALVAVERVSPWIATIIIARELTIMGLRGVVAADGAVMAPSIWGKVKTNVQFFAILFAIVGSAIDYIAGFASALREPPAVELEQTETPEAPETATPAARLAAAPRLHSR